ncbi:hypothetical protein THAOC_24547, partial [Thalassiosira oceanica]
MQASPLLLALVITLLSAPSAEGFASPSSPQSAVSASRPTSSRLDAYGYASSPVVTDILRTSVGLVLARKISRSGLRKGSLSKDGAAAAFAVASLSLGTSWRNGLTLLTFYWTSSRLTRVGSKRKRTLEEGVSEGGNRGAGQVLACSAIGVACALARRAVVGRDTALLTAAATSPAPHAAIGDALTLAYVGFFACCAGDTWASEIGVLSRSRPRSVLRPWRSVPPGTNGGVSLLGLVASAAGGLVVGLVHALLVPGGLAGGLTAGSFRREVAVLGLVGLAGGLGGSMIDSGERPRLCMSFSHHGFLTPSCALTRIIETISAGGTVQATYYDRDAKRITKKNGPDAEQISGFGFLSNEMVNVVSTALASLLAGLAARPLLASINQQDEVNHFSSSMIQDKSKQVHDKVSEQLLRSFAHERNLLVTQHVVLAVALLVVASTFILATLGTRVEPALHTVSVTAAGLVIGVALRPRRTATANPTAVAREPALAYAVSVTVVALVAWALIDNR